jgi:hypothetical protein
MKVRELINELTKFDMNSKVIVGDIKFIKNEREATAKELLDYGVSYECKDYEIVDIFGSVDEVNITIEKERKKVK